MPTIISTITEVETENEQFYLWTQWALLQRACPLYLKQHL